MLKTIAIESTHHKTELCTLAEKYKCDKGPYSEGSVCAGHRKGYTAVYELLFSPLRNKTINMLEIGIQDGDSVKVFTEYFNDVNYYGIDNVEEKIVNSCNLNIPKTQFHLASVEGQELPEMMKKINKQFDIILDDSSHLIEHEINIIQSCAKYLKPGGIFIIEDLERNWEEDIYSTIQDYIKEIFVFETFIIAHHDNRNCTDNDKLWVGIKK